MLGHKFPQILLIHANQLNNDYLDVLLKQTRDLGYEFIDLESAMIDPAYDSRDESFGNSGITWVHRWALTQGKRGDFFGNEPNVPKFVWRVYQ